MQVMGAEVWTKGKGEDGLSTKRTKLDELLTDPPVWHKRLFDTLVGAYDEVEAMGVDPELLMRRWRKRGEK